MDLALLKEQISMMKGTLGDKIEETAKMTEKISNVEAELGSRLSQVNFDAVKKALQTDIDQQDDNNNTNEPSHLEYQNPDYNQISNGNGPDEPKQIIPNNHQQP